MRSIWPLAIIALLGCRTVDERFLRIEREHRDELAKIYPAGLEREAVLLGCGEESVGTWNLAGAAPDPFAKAALDHTRASQATPATRCDLVLTLRSGAVGWWMDYVFYDANDHVIVAYRRLVD